jgi:hypothetical protein
VTIRNTTPICWLGHGIHKVIFLCGDIKDLVFDSDKHCAYLEDSDDIDLNNEFQGLDKDEVEDLKGEYVYMVVFVLFWLADTLPS